MRHRNGSNLDFDIFSENQRDYYDQVLAYGRFIPGWVDPEFLLGGQLRDSRLEVGSIAHLGPYY